MNRRISQRDAQQRFRNMTKLGGRSLDESPARGRVEKEVSNLDGGADVTGCRLGVTNRAASVLDFVSAVACSGAGQNAGMRYRADAGQRFATKTHRHDAKQIFVTDELAGGMGRERQGQIGRLNPAAGIDHPDQRPAAIFDFDDDVIGARIDGILDQLLHDRRWPLDHLARGDAIDHRRRQLLNATNFHAGDYRESDAANERRSAKRTGYPRARLENRLTSVRLLKFSAETSNSDRF